MFEKEAEEIEKEAIKWVKDVFPNIYAWKEITPPKELEK